MKKFIIYKSDGKSETIEADRAEWKKTKGGLFIKFFIGRSVKLKFSEVIFFMEESPAIIPIPARQEINDED